MAGTAWNWFQKATVILLEKLLFTHENIRYYLWRITSSLRTLTAVRSQLAELKKDPALYNSRQRRWTRDAIERSKSKRRPLDTG